MVIKMSTDPCFFFLSFLGFGAIDVYGPKSKKIYKKTGPDQFLDSYVSLCNNFADRMRSTVVSH